jgi:hypothetical protein
LVANRHVPDLIDGQPGGELDQRVQGRLRRDEPFERDFRDEELGGEGVGLSLGGIAVPPTIVRISSIASVPSWPHRR